MITARVWIIWIWIPYAAWALQCWNCHNANSNEECQLKGVLGKCQDENVCSTEVRTTFGQVRMWKRCKQRNACESQRALNWRPTFNNRCNKNQLLSHCLCCCHTDSCNVNEICQVNAAVCEKSSTNLTHGEVTCSNGNNVGSVCRHRCTKAGFQIYPPNTQDSICLGDGHWSNRKPCCAKPCPPYFAVDHVSLLQFNSFRSYKRRVENTAGGLNRFIANEYSGYRNFQITFGDNLKDMKIVGGSTISPLYVNSSKANTGEALQFVFEGEYFRVHVDGYHNDYLLVGVERKSDDDVVPPANALKDAGVIIYYIFYESPGHKVDMNEARAVASSNETIFVVNKGKTQKDFQKLVAGLVNRMCSNPCPHDDDDDH